MSTQTAVLVLDVDSLPLRIAHWKHVIGNALLGSLEVIEYSKDRTIKGVSRDYPMPSVVKVIRRFRRDKQVVKFSRLGIFARDAFTCQYCVQQFLSEELTFDHVLPRSRGGKTTWTNIVTACYACNATKRNQTPEEAGMHLVRAPKKPWALPAILVDMGRERIPEEWRPYWTGGLEG